MKRRLMKAALAAISLVLAEPNSLSSELATPSHPGSGVPVPMEAVESNAATSPVATHSAPAVHERQDASLELIEPGTRTNGLSNLQRTPAQANRFQIAFEAARNMRAEKNLKRAEATLIQLLEGRAPEEIKRPALLELALVMQDAGSQTKAQQLFSEYVRRFSKDPSMPEVLLRQGYLYREMGVPVLALSKFHGVISSCLNLKLDQMDYYQRLVLRAQVEIAETYYLQGKFEEAQDYLNRLLRLDTTDLARAEVFYKLVRCYVSLAKYPEAIAQARLFLEKFSDHVDAPETRFLLANSLKKLGRNGEAIVEIEALLQKQHAQSNIDPGLWRYWQQRAGNDIANQLYQEGDFLGALQVYQKLAELSTAPEWQIPVWYQIGLVYEDLKQGGKAAELYELILERAGDKPDLAPALKAVRDMAEWRKGFLAWESSARAANESLNLSAPR